MLRYVYSDIDVYTDIELQRWNYLGLNAEVTKAQTLQLGQIQFSFVAYFLWEKKKNQNSNLKTFFK